MAEQKPAGGQGGRSEFVHRSRRAHPRHLAPPRDAVEVTFWRPARQVRQLEGSTS